MRRAWWIIRIAVILAASYCIFAPAGTYPLDNVRAEENGCNTNTVCVRNTQNNCYCPDVVVGGPGCNGCFVPNGSSGCGSCSSGAAEIQ